MVRAMRILNAVEAGTTTGTQLEALLIGDAGRLAELNVLLGMRGQSRRMSASVTSMTAVLESPTATTSYFTNPKSNASASEGTSKLNDAALVADMTAVAASATVMTAVASSATAMSAIIASQSATNTFIASSTARDAIIASQSALNAFVSSSAAMSALVASPTALNAFIASSTAMDAVAASTTAMNTVIASSTAKLAMYNSDTALNAISSSAVAISTITGNAAYATFTNLPFSQSIVNIGFTGKAIIVKLSQSWSTSTNNVTIGNLRSGTTISGIDTITATYNETSGVPGNTWVLPALSTATHSNDYAALGDVLNIGFIYV